MSGDEAWRAELREKVSGEIRFDEPADRHTSMGVGGRIGALIYPDSEADLLAAVTSLRECRIPFLPVGNWTNLIVAGGGYGGALISLAALRAVAVTVGDSGEARLEAGAGAALSELVTLAVGRAFTGIEFC
ncbi:MAG: FAD-binding protein, partial [Thermodesulfobacteriota bacterium]